MSRGWRYLRDNPDELKRVREKWHQWQMERIYDQLLDMLFAPNPLFRALPDPDSRGKSITVRREP